ncbi:hypothetical protein BDL97_10G018900 [Sphagnum fallax]|nr:hypothetical protein BDL97_10G018900 [Sphagnum fallax]
MMTLASRLMCKYRSKVSRPYKQGELPLQGYKSQMILCSGIGNENAKEFASSKIACINLYSKRHGLYKQISNMCCRCTLTSVKLISIYTWEWY